jgi:hypothetical protein
MMTMMTPVTVDRVERGPVVNVHETIEVFNLTVEGPEHTYFAADIAVHNKSVHRPCKTDCDDKPMATVPPGSVEPQTLAIRNDDRVPLVVSSVSPPVGDKRMIEIDERVIDGRFEIELPAAEAFGVTNDTRELKAGGIIKLGRPDSSILVRRETKASSETSPETSPETPPDDTLPTAADRAFLFELGDASSSSKDSPPRRYLAHGHGVISIRRSADGGVEAFLPAIPPPTTPSADDGPTTSPSSTLPLRLLPLYPRARGRTASICSVKDRPVVKFDPTIPKGKQFTASVPKPSSNLGCNEVTLTEVAAATPPTPTTPYQLCVPTGVPWPFKDGDRIATRNLSDLVRSGEELNDRVFRGEASIEGIRFESTSQLRPLAFIELAHITEQPTIESTISLLGDSVVLKEDISCELAPPDGASSSCPSIRVHAKSFLQSLVGEHSIANPLERDHPPLGLFRVAIIQATTSPISFPCSSNRIERDLAAWSK